MKIFKRRKKNVAISRRFIKVTTSFTVGNEVWIEKKVQEFHPIARRIFEDKILMGVWSTKGLRDFIRSLVEGIRGK